MKHPEHFEELLKADRRREKFILLGEIVVLLVVASALAWYFYNVYLVL